MELTPIQSSFIRRHVFLSWRDMLWGYKRRLIEESSVIAMAQDRLLCGSNDPLEVELASLRKSEIQEVGELLCNMAGKEPEVAGAASAKKWLFLVLAWLFEQRSSVSDPFCEINSIYADFDYPPEIEGFVSYMPPSDGHDPLKHSKEENESRLLSKWEQFLFAAKQELGKDAGFSVCDK